MGAYFLAPDEFRQPIEIMTTLAGTAESQKSSEDAQNVNPESATDQPNSPDFIDTDVSHAPIATATEEGEVATYRSAEVGPSREGENPGDNNDEGLRTAYLAALRAAIRQHWNYQGPQQQCNLTIKQSPGGAVQSAVAGECSFEAQDRRALEAAVLMAQPLPYAGYETVFGAEISLRF